MDICIYVDICILCIYIYIYIYTCIYICSQKDNNVLSRSLPIRQWPHGNAYT